MNKYSVMILTLFALFSVNSFAQKGTFAKTTEGGGHVGVDMGTFSYPNAEASFGYNQGAAWVRLEAGEWQSYPDVGSVWESSVAEQPIEGLTYLEATHEIVYKGVVCAVARPNAAFSGADYPAQYSDSCKFVVTKNEVKNFKGEVRYQFSVSISTQN